MLSWGLAMVTQAERLKPGPMFRNRFVPASAPALPRPDGSGDPAAMDPRIVSVLEAVMLGLDQPQSLKHYTAQLRISPSRFEHLFKKETGQGFKGFVRAARLAKANDLLQDRTLRIKEVAAAVGYGDVSHFVRDLKRRFCRSPAQSRSPSP